jgi:4-aminobutyrate aminotransferase-like enzyme/Ser/Thr protein kinase RdoA (MazF antagonist)
MTEGPLAVPAPPVSAAEAVRLACSLYDLGPEAAVRALPLPGEYDANFEIAAGERGRFVLKVMHPARDRSLVDLQCSALEHLAGTAPSLPLPRVAKTRTGDLLALVNVRSEGSATRDRLVWMLGFIDGTPFAEVRPQTDAMLVSLGRTLGALDRGLADFAHPASERDFKWDLAKAGWIEGSLQHIADPARRALVEGMLAFFKSHVVPALPTLRRSVIHSDANDYNVLVRGMDGESREAASVIDFGDMHLGLTVAEVAIGATYALLGRHDPLAAAALVVRGYHTAYPLEERELDVVFPLILTRLAVSVTNSAIRKDLKPEDPYVTISEAPAWRALELLSRVPKDMARAALRHACGYSVVREADVVGAWIKANAGRMAPVLDIDLKVTPSLVFDLSVGSTLLGADPETTETTALSDLLFREMRKALVNVGVGRYDEARLLYGSPLFGQAETPTDERRTIHLGVDLFVAAGSRVHAPLEGVVHLVANNNAPQDYGPMVILKHSTGDGRDFFTLYGHLSEGTLTGLKEGQRVKTGEELARVGSPPSNGGWPPHLHFQIILDLLELGRDFPGVCRHSEREFWKALSPDPNLILGIPAERFGESVPSAASTLGKRRLLLGGNLSVSYERPLKMVRGFGAWLYDETGRAFLDMYNNVPLVGHSHPRVVRAIQAQVGLLNTNTRYLHDNAVRYAERLTALLPGPLRVCFFVNSGSEANDLALRMARTHTKREDIIVLENAYHGNTTSLIEVSPYKFEGPGGAGRKPFVHVAPMPDDYRGPYRREDAEAGPKYGRAVGEVAERLRLAGTPPAAFIAETLPSVGGQIVPPPGYLREAYRHVRSAGGLCIADEVQVGFGRLGTHFWGFEMQGVVPDMVVLGKPIGNGIPLAAVITTKAIAQSFDNGMEFFSTFGGNPVSCAAGLAVLDVVRDEGLQRRALAAGDHLIAGLRSLMSRHPLIGDVRGSGLFVGVELVCDRDTRQPAPTQARYLVNRLRERGILAGTDGPHDNVIKLRPPLMVSSQDIDLFLGILDDVLCDDRARP